MAVSCILAELPVPGLLPSGLGPLLGAEHCSFLFDLCSFFQLIGFIQTP